MSIVKGELSARSWDVFSTWPADYSPATPLILDWNVVDEFSLLYERLLDTKLGVLESLLIQWNAKLGMLGEDPTYINWSNFRPLRLSREEDWSDWLTFLIETSTTGVFSHHVLRSEAEVADFSRPYNTFREESYKGYRGDIVVEWNNKHYAHIEVKIGDPNLYKTFRTSEALRQKFHVAATNWKNYILLLDSQLSSWDATRLPDDLHVEVDPFTWTDVCIGIRRSLLSHESLVWKSWAYAFLGAVEQQLIGFPGHLLEQGRPGTGLDEKIDILRKGLEYAT